MTRLNCKASVGCLVRSGDHIILVYEQQAGVGSWDIPAGGIEHGETPEQAIRRELHEEIGLERTDNVRLTSIFWATLNGTPTAHFLYSLEIDEVTVTTLKPNTTDIQEIAQYSHAEIQEIIETKAYEHSLAEARFRFYLDNEPGGKLQMINVL